MAKITWPNRTDLKTAIGATYEWAAAIANEVKTSVNALYDKTELNTWHVNKNGDDANVGSANFPFETIKAAQAVMAGGDIIKITSIGYSSNETITFDKEVTIRGPVSDSLWENTRLSGTYTISGGVPLAFENITFLGSIVSATVYRLWGFNSWLKPSALSARRTVLEMSNCQFNIDTDSELKSLIALNTKIINELTLNVGGSVELRHSSCEGTIVCGLDSSASVVLRTASIKGDLTITGNLDQENSTVLGALSVSANTTGGSRFPGQVAAVGKELDFTATPVIDFNESVCQQMTLTGNITSFATTNEFSPVNGDVYLINDGSVRTVAAPTGWEPDTTSETHSTVANAINRYQFYTLPNFGTKFYNIHIVKS